jgi:hypothetical protein
LINRGTHAFGGVRGARSASGRAHFFFGTTTLGREDELPAGFGAVREPSSLGRVSAPSRGASALSPRRGSLGRHGIAGRSEEGRGCGLG